MKTPIALITLAIAACAPAEAPTPAPMFDPVEWDDGDSGTIGGALEFRLANVDAPETGGVGAAYGGAECEAERCLGELAKAYMADQTDGAEILFTPLYRDRFDRTVGILYADGRDVRQAGAAAGYLRAWPYDENGRALAPKPDWCAAVAD